MQPIVIERFWSKVDKGSACWTWVACKDTGGYGLLKVNGKMLKAHRVSYEINVGPIPSGMVIDHRCYNRACIRPEHLQVVTNKQNCENRSVRNANNKSGMRGVYWHKRDKRWYVQVNHAGRSHSGGYHDDLQEAAEAARQLRLSLFTNNPLDRMAHEETR